MPTLLEMRDINTAKTAIRIITNETLPTRHYFINKNTHENSGNRTFWKSGHRRAKDQKNTFLKTTSMEEDTNTIKYNRPTTYYNTNIKHRRFQTETYELLDEKYKKHTKVYTDGFSKDRRLTCAIVTPECKIGKECEVKIQYTLQR
jgi:hypothetical protein